MSTIRVLVAVPFLMSSLMLCFLCLREWDVGAWAKRLFVVGAIFGVMGLAIIH